MPDSVPVCCLNRSFTNRFSLAQICIKGPLSSYILIIGRFVLIVKEVWEQKIKRIMQTLQLNMRIFFHSSAFWILSRYNTSLKAPSGRSWRNLTIVSLYWLWSSYNNRLMIFPIYQILYIVSYNTFYYNIVFVNSERWLAKSRVDITPCQHGKFPVTLLFKLFVLYYKRNIKHFFRIDIQLYQHSWKLE